MTAKNETIRSREDEKRDFTLGDEHGPADLVGVGGRRDVDQEFPHFWDPLVAVLLPSLVEDSISCHVGEGGSWSRTLSCR